MFLFVSVFQYFQTKWDLHATFYITQKKKNNMSRKNWKKLHEHLQHNKVKAGFCPALQVGLILVTFWHSQHSPFTQIP